MLDQAAASDAKLNAMLAACPVPTALFEESGTGQASASQNPDDIARHEAGEEGFLTAQLGGSRIFTFKSSFEL